MSTIKIFLRKKPNKAGLFPITVRITKNRKSTYLYTGKYIDEKYWDSQNLRVRKSHPNSVRLNNFIQSKLAEINDTLLEAEKEKKNIGIKTIKKELVSTEENNFFEVAKVHFNNLIDRNKNAQYKIEQSRINRLKVFLKTDEIAFEDLTVELLQKFQSHLRTKHKIKQRTVVNYLIVIRTIYNLAIEKGIVDRSFYPFGKGKIVIKFPESEKVGLNINEVKVLENLTDLTQSERYALDVWLFSFYFAGMRIGDVLRIKNNNFIDGRLSYRMNKNQKLLSLKIPQKAIPIVEKYQYKGKRTDFLFPELKKANLENEEDINLKIRTANSTINKHLKNIAKKANIDKKLSCHIARHTFGNISGNTISVQILQKLYRHSSISTTINYQSNFIHKDFDEALDNVVDF